MNQITDDLWVSDIDTVQRHSTDRFDLVLSVCQDACPDNVGCRYEHVPLADDAASEARWGGTTAYTDFADACTICRDALASGETTLVHCHAGQNRSVAVCTAVLGVTDGCCYNDAFLRVRDARPIANPAALMRRHAMRYIENADGSVGYESE